MPQVQNSTPRYFKVVTKKKEEGKEKEKKKKMY